MAKSRRQIVPGVKIGSIDTPGSVFKPTNCDRLYIKFMGKRYATGLHATKEGVNLAKEMLKKKYLDYHNLKPEATTLTFAEAWEAFEKTLVNKSYKTIVNYNLSFRNIITEPNNYISAERVEDFVLEYLRKTKHSKISKNTNLRQLQVFLNYCTERKWIEVTKFKSKFGFATNDPTAKSFSEMEQSKLVLYFFRKNPEIAYLIFFMLETGARVVDALTLEWSQVDIENGYITWKNKITKTDEKRPISNKTIKILKWLKQRNIKKVFSYSYNTSTNLNKKLNVAMEVIGIQKAQRSFQEFRVSFRMKLAEKGMPENLIEYLLRHHTGKLIHNHYTNYQAFENEIRTYLNS